MGAFSRALRGGNEWRAAGSTAPGENRSISPDVHHKSTEERGLWPLSGNQRPAEEGSFGSGEGRGKGELSLYLARGATLGKRKARPRGANIRAHEVLTNCPLDRSGNASNS